MNTFKKILASLAFSLLAIPAFAVVTHQEYTAGKQAPFGSTGHVTRAYATVDLSHISVAAVTSDVVTVLRIPGGAFVSDVQAMVTTVEGTTCTASVGAGASSAGWMGSLDLNTLGFTGGGNTDPYRASAGIRGHFYAVADDSSPTTNVISITLGNSCSHAIFTIYALEHYLVPKV